MAQVPALSIPRLLSRLPADVVPRTGAVVLSGTQTQTRGRRAGTAVRGTTAAIAGSATRALAVWTGSSSELQRYLLAGSVVVFLLIGGLGGWAATASLAGAVIVQGTVVVDSNSKKVQHQSGGIVGEILVKEGDHVSAGDLLIRLDETVTRANLLVITKQLDEIVVRQARLRAERDGGEAIAIPKGLADRTMEADIAEIISGERALFESRRNARAGQAAQMKERIAQLHEEITGLAGQQAANAKQIALIQQELKGVEDLFAKSLVPMTRVTSLQREASRLEGESAQLIASAAQAKGKIAETELQIIQIGQDFRTEVVKELRDLQGKEAELAERRVAAEDQLKRIEIRSPQTGTVHQLSVHTVGGVIAPGEQIMMVVPEGDTLVIDARIAPQDIDRVHVGQDSFVRFPAFNMRTTPEFHATVSRIAADTARDSQTSQAYYLARIILTDAELKRLGSLKLMPGMPAEIHITTAGRTALSYFIKPLQDQMSNAFKEQ